MRNFSGKILEEKATKKVTKFKNLFLFWFVNYVNIKIYSCLGVVIIINIFPAKEEWRKKTSHNFTGLFERHIVYVLFFET